jgi:hypothetical protein
MSCSRECYDKDSPYFGYSLCSNCPGRDDGSKAPQCVWIINAGGFGAFLFEGTAEEAEEMRRHKANYERGIGKKRLATAEEMER